MSIGLILSFTFISISAYTLKHYCSEKASCASKVNNIVCARQNERCRMGRECIMDENEIKEVKFGLSSEDRKEILKHHNILREKIASGEESRGGGMPHAANMRALSYNYELEFSAQCRTNSCVIHYESCFKTPQFQSFGQNIQHNKQRTNVDWQRVITAWYEEIKQYRNKNKYVSNENTRHFSQVIWAKTERVGCGQTDFVNNYTLIACNYYPAGNAGLRIYKAGKPNTRCKKGLKSNKRYPHLCGEDRLEGRPHKSPFRTLDEDSAEFGFEYGPGDDVPAKKKKSRGCSQVSVSKLVFLIIFIFCV